MVTSSPLVRNQQGGFDVPGVQSTLSTSFEGGVLPSWLQLVPSTEDADYTNQVLSFGAAGTSQYAEIKTSGLAGRKAGIRGIVDFSTSSVYAMRLQAFGVYAQNNLVQGEFALANRVSPRTVGVSALSSRSPLVNDGNIVLTPYPGGAAAGENSQAPWITSSNLGRRRAMDLWYFPASGWVYYGFQGQIQFAKKFDSTSLASGSVAPILSITATSSSGSWLRLSGMQFDIWRTWAQ